MIILFWGAGAELYRFLKKWNISTNIFEGDSLIITDKDEKKINSSIFGIKVISIEDAMRNEVDMVVVGSTNYFADISNDIRKAFPDKPIYKLKELLNKKIIKKQIKSLEKCNVNRTTKINFLEKKILVYTVIIGDYDSLKDPIYIDKGIKYICFTNQTNLHSEIWEIRKIDISNKDILDYVKRIKMFPDDFIEEKYDISVYIDATFTIKNSLNRFLEDYYHDSDILLFPHPERICIYEEAAFCLLNGVGDKDALIKQIGEYYSNGFPKDAGLYCGGIIVRRKGNKVSEKAMEEWYKEFKKFSVRDQISLPYVLKKNEVNVELVDLNIFENQFFFYINHKM